MPKLTTAERFARMAQDRTIEPKLAEPKWGLDRRRRITLRMVNPDYRRERHEVITFLRKVMRSDLNRFFDETATEHDMQNVERILKI